jgi:Ceramidase
MSYTSGSGKKGDRSPFAKAMNHTAQKYLRWIAIALVATALMGTGFLILNQYADGSFWEGMKLSNSVSTHEFCETIEMDSFFRQRSNAWSNLIYFFFGMLILQQAREDFSLRKNESGIAGFSALSFTLGFCFIYLCLGSTFFHASLTWAGQRMDMNAVYSVALTICVLGIYVLFLDKPHFSKWKPVIIAGLLLLIISFIWVHLVTRATLLLPLLLSISTVISIFSQLKYPKRFQFFFAILSLVLLLSANGLRIMDVSKIGCDSQSLIQGHAVWHLLTAAGAFSQYLYFAQIGRRQSLVTS